MMIVPPELIQRLKSDEHPDKNILSQLDDEMHKVLKSRLADHDKWVQYNQVLQRYLHFTDQSRQSIKIPIETNSNRVSNTDIVSTLPATFKKKAEALLRILSTSDEVDWDDKGLVTIKGEILPSSNIIDLVHDTLRPRKAANPPGRVQFSEYIKDRNVARVLLPDSKTVKNVTDQLVDPGKSEVATDNYETETESGLSPAVRKTLKKRKPPPKGSIIKTSIRARSSTQKKASVLGWERLKP